MLQNFCKITKDTPLIHGSGFMAGTGTGIGAGITGIGIMDMSGGGMDTGDTGCRYHRQNTD